MSDGLPPLNPPRKKLRGFAAMDPEKRREAARKGGASVPADRRSFAQDRALAAEAGKKGGEVGRRGVVRKPRPQEPGAARERQEAMRLNPTFKKD
jgi:general stress protein YciG